jgi:hypothetical protein
VAHPLHSDRWTGARTRRTAGRGPGPEADQNLQVMMTTPKTWLALPSSSVIGLSGTGDSWRRLPSQRFFGIVALNYRLPGFFDRAIVFANFTNPKKQQNQGVIREGAIA